MTISSSGLKLQLLCVTSSLVAVVALLCPQPADSVTGQWFVATTGSDTNDCLTPATACATPSVPLQRPGFNPGDTIFVAGGVYAPVLNSQLSFGTDAHVSGGWDLNFTAQVGSPTVVGGLNADSGAQISVEHFTVLGPTLNLGAVLTLTHIVAASLYNRGTTVVVDSSIQGANNQPGGVLILNRSAVSQGHIFNLIGQLTLNDSTISYASSDSLFGGAIENDMGGGTVILNNSTLSHNRANTGGAISNKIGGTLVLNNTTVTANEAETGGGIANYSGTVLSMTNSIVAGNYASNQGPDCWGDTFTSLGYNLIGTIQNCSFGLIASDLVNVDARLGELEGWPPYSPLLVGSPAINAGNPNGCMGSTGLLATDQRGKPRLGRCDMGAVEAQALDTSMQTFAPNRLLTRRSLLTYTLVANNIGAALNAASVMDNLPASLPLMTGTLAATGGMVTSMGQKIRWDGALGSNQTVSITFQVKVGTAAPFGIPITNSMVLTGSNGEVVTRTSSITPKALTFLPAVSDEYCPPLVDDFSSGQGWSLLDNSIARLAYIAGEYQAWLKQGGYRFFVRAPTCPRENYVVEVDGHWAGTPGYRYGLIFGAARDLSSHFLFDVDTQQQLYRLWYCYPNSSCSGLATDTYDPVIRLGNAINHFKATRNGQAISLELNGTLLGKWTTYWGSGSVYVGLTVSSATGQMADARFDNFSVSNLSSTGMAVPAAGTTMRAVGSTDTPWRALQPSPITSAP